MLMKTSNFFFRLLSLFIMVLFISSQVKVAESTSRQQGNEVRLDCVPLPPPPPPPGQFPPPTFAYHSNSSKGKGP
ncbi:unnamed protein product [Cochlearia groenlandica]